MKARLSLIKSAIGPSTQFSSDWEDPAPKSERLQQEDPTYVRTGNIGGVTEEIPGKSYVKYYDDPNQQAWAERLEGYGVNPLMDPADTAKMLQETGFDSLAGMDEYRESLGMSPQDFRMSSMGQSSYGKSIADNPLSHVYSMRPEGDRLKAPEEIADWANQSSFMYE